MSQPQEEEGQSTPTVRGFWLQRLLLFAAGAFTFYLIALYPVLSDLQQVEELEVRFGLFTIAIVVLLLTLWYIGYDYKRREKEACTEKPPTCPPKAKTAIVFVHGMGVQDKHQMVVNFSDGLRNAAQRPYSVSRDLDQKVRTDAVSLCASDGVDHRRIDIYEAYWGHLFTGINKWQSAVIFGLTTMFKAIPTLFTRVWKKRAFDLFYASLGLLLVGSVLLVIYGGFRISALRLALETSKASTPILTPLERETAKLPERVDYLTPPEVNQNTMRTRVIESLAFLKVSFGEGMESLAKPLNLDLDLNKALKNLGEFSLERLVIGFVYSIAWFYMFLTFFQFLGSSLSYSGKRKQHATIGYQILTGMVATGIYIWLDPKIELFLVQAMICASLLYVLLWGMKYWFTNFLGDVQIYTSTNANSAFYKARDEAITLVEKKLAEVLNAGYTEVIVVAHSLGSAVALSALRRLSMNASVNTDLEGGPCLPPNFKAFFTIGSPLRKIRQLFQTKSYKWDYLEFNTETDRCIFSYGGKSGVPWFNFYYPTDIFGDQLCYINFGSDVSRGRDITGFRIEPTRDHKLKSPWKVWSHSDYWENPKFVRPFLQTVFSDHVADNVRPEGHDTVDPQRY